MKLVIKQHRPRQRILLGLGLLIVVAGAIAIAFHYGHWRTIVHSMGTASLKRGIMDDYVDLRDENRDLQQQLARLKRTVEIDQHARSDFQKTVSALQSEIADLKLELAFYRDILSSTEPEKGPHVRGFRLRDYGSTGRYQYRLVLTHVNKDDKVASGRVDVEIRGKRSGTKQNFSLLDLTGPEGGDLAFNFKHFRRFEGVLELPEDFKPEEVYVAVYEEGRKKSSFNKIYNWSKLIN